MNSINNMNSGNVQFEGLSALRRASSGQRKYCAEMISGILHQDQKDIMKLTKNASEARISFIRKLADRYNKDNFYRSAAEREDSKLVNRIFKTVKFPMDVHNELAYNYNGSLNSLFRVFSETGMKLRRINFAQKVNREILTRHPDSYQDLLPELLESPNSKEYVRNYGKYRSYLKLNRNNKEVVKNLDEMVANGTYNRNKYEILYENQNIRSQFMLPETNVFNAEHFVENYSDAGKEFLEYVVTHFIVEKKTLASGADVTLFDMFKTSTNKNIDLRINIMKVLANIRVSKNNPEAQAEQFKELKKLYDTIDNDPYARKFMQDLVSKPIYEVVSINNINKVLTEIPTKKLAMFSANARNIISQTKGEERIDVLKNEIENPFFETEAARANRMRAIKHGYAKKDSPLKKLTTRIKNAVKILQYRKMEAKEKPVLESIIKPQVTQETTKNSGQVVEEKPVVKELDVIDALDKKIQEEAVKIEEEIRSATVKSADKKKAGKEEVKKNVFEIISSKLGPKAYAVQQDAYGAYATKIRLGMLPEIFSSIADTRKADRAAGKYRINSSNKDALELYLLINGNNKKYVNYLLKKRNVDNTRMFEVKDIISMLKKAEAKIQKDKQTNPDYRAADARKYYNHLYESKIQQYGKVKRTVNTKA